MEDFLFQKRYNIFMNFLLIMPYYFRWHYGRAFSDMKNIWGDFIVFVYHFFSIPTLFSSLFSPLERRHDSYSVQVPLYETFIFNTIMRLLGASVRLFLIFFGLLAILLSILLGIGLFVAWIFMPAVILGVLFWGFANLVA